MVETNYIRASKGDCFDSEARALARWGSPNINERGQVPSMRPIVEIGDQIVKSVGCSDWRVAGDDDG